MASKLRGPSAVCNFACGEALPARLDGVTVLPAGSGRARSLAACSSPTSIYAQRASAFNPLQKQPTKCLPSSTPLRLRCVQVQDDDDGDNGGERNRREREEEDAVVVVARRLWTDREQGADMSVLLSASTRPARLLRPALALSNAALLAVLLDHSVAFEHQTAPLTDHLPPCRWW